MTDTGPDSMSPFAVAGTEILAEQPRIARAVRMFVARETGEPLADIVAQFAQAAAMPDCGGDADVYYLAAYTHAQLHHLEAMATLHAALCTQYTFLREDLPGLPIEPAALRTLDTEITRIYEIGNFVGRMATDLLRDIAPVLEDPDEAARFIGHHLQRLEDDGDFMAADLPDIPATRQGCIDKMYELSQNASDAYRAVMVAELQEIKLDLGYHGHMFGQEAEPQRPLSALARPHSRADYTGIVQRQMRLVGIHHQLALMADTRGGKGGPTTPHA